MADPKEFVVKTREQIRDDYTRTIKAGLVDIGIPNPNVSEGTLDYLRGDALGAFGEDIGNQVEIKANAALPDSAGKNDPAELQRLSKIVGLDLRPAGPSLGGIVIETSALVPVAVPSGAQLINNAGLTFETTAPGPYSDGDTVPCRSIDTGDSTNLEAGETLRWVSAPPFVLQTATVAVGGFTGGVNDENIEGLRERLLSYYKSAPGGGNWGQVAQVAENSSTFVQRAYIYPAVYGGNTMHVAVTRAPTETNKGRELDATIVTQVVGPAVLAAFPTFADITVTSVDDYPSDVVVALALPTSKKASPPGPGGGWLDGNPWPTPLGSATFAPITAVVNSTDFTVESALIPVVGQHVVYISPVDFYVYRGIIQTVATASPNNYRITVDVPFLSERATSTSIAIGDWLFPDAERMDVYLATLLATFASLGPNEKTTSPGLLPRAARKPSTLYDSPSALGPFALRKLILSGEEVLDASYLTAPSTAPVADGYQVPPKILTPEQIAIYPME